MGFSSYSLKIITKSSQQLITAYENRKSTRPCKDVYNIPFPFIYFLGQFSNLYICYLISTIFRVSVCHSFVPSAAAN